jgi:membrane associated rhomboid family serine protease
MYFLYIFGDNVEDRVGRFRFLVIYLVFGLFAGATQTAFSLGSDAPLVGASGAIAGLMGAYLVLFPKVRVYQVLFFIRIKIPMWVYLIIWMALQTLSGFIAIQQHQTTGVAFWAHVGGFAAGAFWGALNRAKYAVTSS